MADLSISRFLPVQKFTHEEKQTRKRVWWGCIILDRYTARSVVLYPDSQDSTDPSYSYIGRPGNIHERDYDTSFPSDIEPDENEKWRPLRPDGREFSSVGALSDATDPLAGLSRYPTTKAHSLSCFNAAGALAVIINRVSPSSLARLSNTYDEDVSRSSLISTLFARGSLDSPARHCCPSSTSLSQVGTSLCLLIWPTIPRLPRSHRLTYVLHPLYNIVRH